jgi:biopolymer transport protein ExbB
MREQEKGLSILSSIGSTAPFVGLFGTVWGIVNALSTISASGQATIDIVAGPIGEALIATAIGIGVAIPSVVAYNYFLRRIKLLITDVENFSEDLIRLASRELNK